MMIFLSGILLSLVMVFNHDIGSFVASKFNATWVGIHPAWAAIPLVALIFHLFVVAMHRKYVEMELAVVYMKNDINALANHIPVLQIVGFGLALSEHLISSDEAKNASLGELTEFVRNWIKTIHDKLDDVSTVDALHFGDESILDEPSSTRERQILMTIVATRVVMLRQIEQRHLLVSPPTPDTPHSPNPAAASLHP